MICGVDISHDKLMPGSYDSVRRESSRGAEVHSTASFCASYDSSLTNYHSYVAEQPREDQYVQASTEFMRSAVIDYKEKNGHFPNVIIIYRDGVANSQIDTFVQCELRDYERAFDQANVLPRPKMLVVVVQKRLSTRFFDICDKWKSAQSRNGREANCRFSFKCDGRSKYHSPLPGTVVDEVVVSSKLSDFYLIPSQAPPNATARPTRFIVVRDDLNIDTDTLQNLTNQLCYIYLNWTGPIRVPCVTMYASKLAYLFAKIVKGTPNNLLQGKVFYL